MPPVTEYLAVDLSYTEEEDWATLLTRLHVESQMAGQPWALAFAIPVNASRAKVVYSRTVDKTDAEVAAILNPPPKPDPRVEAFGPVLRGA